MNDSRDLGHHKYKPKWSPELTKLKKDAHWYADNAFISRSEAYYFMREHTGKAHISDMNKNELETVIAKMKKVGAKKLLRGEL